MEYYIKYKIMEKAKIQGFSNHFHRENVHKGDYSHHQCNVISM